MGYLGYGYRWAEPEMTETIRFNVLGRQDLRVGRGTFLATLADNREVTMDEIYLPEYAEDSGTTDAYAITLDNVGTPYVTGMVYYFKANTANTGAATLNINSNGAKTIKKQFNQDLIDNDIRATQIVCVVYDGTNFQMLNHTGNFLINDLASQVYAADAGVSDAYAITLTPVPTAYVTGMIIHFKANTLNTGAATLNVNSLGVKTIKKDNNADLETGDIVASQIVSVIYDGTNFQLLSLTSSLAYINKANIFTSNQRINAGLGINAAPPATGKILASDTVEGSDLVRTTENGARVYKSAGQSITDSTLTTLTFDVETYDTNVMHDNVTNNSRITFPVAGLYLVGASVDFNANATGSRFIEFRLNGTTTTFGAASTEAVSLASTDTMVPSIITRRFAINDYIELRVIQSSGGALNVIGGDGGSSGSQSTGTIFWAERIRA